MRAAAFWLWRVGNGGNEEVETEIVKERKGGRSIKKIVKESRQRKRERKKGKKKSIEGDKEDRNKKSYSELRLEYSL